jgi:anti-sigma regulatory factor (Ser/Thr protein kinase)
MHTNVLSVPATVDSLAAIAAFVTAAAEAAGLDRQAGYRLRLAVDEIATNVIAHGHAGAADPGPIEVRAALDEKALTVTLEDTGVPFDPCRVPPPGDLDLPAHERRVGGLGIYLAREGVDFHGYERVRGRNRNVFVVNRPR